MFNLQQKRTSNFRKVVGLKYNSLLVSDINMSEANRNFTLYQLDKRSLHGGQ